LWEQRAALTLDRLDTVQFAHVNRQEVVIRRTIEDVGELSLIV